MASVPATPYPVMEERDLIDLRMLGMIVRRRLKTFLLIAFPLLLIGLGVLPFLPKQFSSTANLQIERRTQEVTEVESVLSDLPDDSASVDTEAQVLRSPAIVGVVVDRLRLVNNPEFNAALRPPGALDGIKDSIKSALGMTADAVEKSPRDRVIEAVAQQLEVQRKGLTYVIGVSFVSENPRTAAEVVNAIAVEYLAQQVRAKRDAARQATRYLNSRLSGLSAEVQGREAAAETLRAQAGLPSASNLSTFDQQVIQDLSRQEIQLRSDLADKRGQLAAAQAARENPGALPAVIESATVRDLKGQRATALARLADVEARYGPLHPATQNTRDQLAQIDREIAAETGRIVTSLNSDVAAAQGRLAAIQQALGAQRGASVTNSRAAARVSQIDREAQSSRGLYEDFLKRSKETATTADLARPDASIVNLGRVPNKPAGPNLPLLAALVFLAAFGAGAVAMLVAELMDVKVNSGDDVERHLGLHKIASIPGVDRPSDSLAFMVENKPLSSYAEAYRTLATYLGKRERAPGDGAMVLMTASALPHEGKTTVAASLALSLARTGARVLVIDTDLRRPNLAVALGVGRPEHGVTEVVSQDLPVDQAIVRLPDHPVDALLVSQAPQDVEMFRTPAFADFLRRVKPRYDYIVIDTPPVLAISDPRLIAPLADSVLLVTRWRRTSRFAARAAVDALRDAGAPLLGVVLNAVDLRTQSLYARDDALSFYGSYRKYYAQ